MTHPHPALARVAAPAIAAVLLALAPAGPASAAPAVHGSKHDLSVTGPGPIRALDESNACVFCHVPHSGLTNRPPLTANHRPYESSTLTVRIGAPSGATRICLSCHDGTIAVGQILNRRIPTTFGTIPADRPSNLGTDLRRTHPVSFHPGRSPVAHPPPPGDAVALDKRGELQCTACHDPHREFGDPVRGKFLVKPTERSALCLTCHEGVRTGAPGSSHATSGATFGEAEGNSGKWGSVAEAGCAACHVSHGADVRGQLVPRPRDDDDTLCLRCHATQAARLNIGRELAKPSAHLSPEKGVHDAGEGRPGAAHRLPETAPGAKRHVNCVDCHDPHAASARPAIAPGVGGALAGVWGVDQHGNRVEQVSFEYELCFKCHGDSANKPQSLVPASGGSPRHGRADANLRAVFASSSPSSHPVVAPGRNGNVPSLKPPLSATSVITCGDCHASDGGPSVGGTAPRGPHGSTYAPLLERAYLTADGTVESPAAYALCYKCHDREKLLGAASTFATVSVQGGAILPLPLHGLHVGEVNGSRRVNAPCSACHTAHGTSARTGTAAENAHLVDFDLGIVKPAADGRLAYRGEGPSRGSCTLSCHGKEHVDLSYSPAAAAAKFLQRGGTSRGRTR